MKMHFGQLQKEGCGRKDREPAKAGVSVPIPSWVPPAWKIPLIDKNGGKKAPKDDRPRVELPVDERMPEEDTPFREPDEQDRGVVILEFGARKKDI